MAQVHYCAQISVEMQRDKRIWRKSIIVPQGQDKVVLSTCLSPPKSKQICDWVNTYFYLYSIAFSRAILPS